MNPSCFLCNRIKPNTIRKKLEMVVANIFPFSHNGSKKNSLKVVNCLPNDKNLDWSKLRAFADHKINVKEKLKFGF